MCGIVGLFSAQRSVSADALQRATRALHHRGPDASREWLSASGRVGLGHARLSIIDLEHGHQPLSSRDGQLQVVVNGEFYDFERIRSDLEGRGHRFRTGSDSEIVLHLYEEYGAQCVQHLRGEFAFVLWDERRQLLLAARDRFGIKPLFYADFAGVLGLASEVKALLAAGMTARWDHQTFAQSTLLTAFAPDRSWFEGIQQLLPGHYLLVTARERRLVRYWDFDYAREGGERVLSEGECVEQVHAALDEAVRLRLRADVPVGCYLSGGIDSCAVIGLAARHSSKPVRAFNISFAEPEYDEQAIAREMAERCNAELVSVPITQANLAEGLADAVWHAEQPFPNAHAAAKFLLSRAVREHGYRVVLTGEGSDEVFAGYPHFRRDLLLAEARGQGAEGTQARLEALDRGNAVSRGLLMPEGQTLSVAHLQGVLGFVPAWMEAFASVGFKYQSILAPEFLASQRGRNAHLDVLDGLDVRGQLHARPPVHQSMYLWSKTMLPNYILSLLGDRMEMAHSVEGRLPFLDHPLVELVCSLPMSFKIRGLTEKYVLREAARPVLTRTVYERQKHPFLAPPSVAAPESPLHELLQTTLRGRALDRVPFFDRQRLLAVLDGWPQTPAAARPAVDALFLQVLTSCIVAERFGMS